MEMWYNIGLKETPMRKEHYRITLTLEYFERCSRLRKTLTFRICEESKELAIEKAKQEIVYHTLGNNHMRNADRIIVDKCEKTYPYFAL